MLTVSDTAYTIAQIRADESSRPASERLFDDPYASVFAAAGEHAREGTQRFMSLPFFCDGIRLRTRFFDDFVRDGVRDGLTQVVILGAGFDARGMRLAEVTAHGARVYEVDFGHVLDAKRALLGEVPSHVAYVACDLAAPDYETHLTEALVAQGFAPGRGALFVWEGVVSYLSADAIARGLRFMAAAGGPTGRAAFDYGDGFLWPDSLPELARRSGFDAVAEVSYDALWRAHLPGDPPDAASVCRAAVASHTSG